MSEGKEGFEEEVIKGIEKRVSGYTDSKEYYEKIKNEFASDQKFEGAKFVANFVLTRENIEKGVARKTKIGFFKDVVEDALDRVKNDLVTEMTLKDPDTFVRKISDEEIDKFIQHGIRIIITGRIKE